LPIRRAINLARQFALTDETVLIQGETGAGKDLFAQGIHMASYRKNGPFWAVNCAALPENLLESELFGYEEGAFTGARKSGKKGYFELADHGTLFLDEIGEINLNVQAKLLRAIEQKQILRLGGKQLIPTDVRIVCATNVDLKRAVQEKRFREDLYFRINVLQLRVPPLRDRENDLNELIPFFIRKTVLGERFSEEDVLFIRNTYYGYSWPGNVRELENAVRRYAAMSMAFDSREEARAFFLQAAGTASWKRTVPGTSTAGESEKGAKELSAKQIETALQQSKGNKTQAARILGISRVTLWRLLSRKQSTEIGD